jgi:uncharacterized protein
MKAVLKTIIIDSQERKLIEMKARRHDIPLESPMITTLIGPRRSGKTYILHDLYKGLVEQGVNRQQLVFINFEDERLSLEASNLDLIIQAYQELYPSQDLDTCYFFFDEIQNVEGWEKFIRRMYDNISKRIYITGSNAKLLSTEIATSLRGRSLTYTVFPLSLNEYLDFRGIKPTLYNSQQKALFINACRSFILEGGFPETVELDGMRRLKLLQNYFNTMIYRDIIDRYKVSDVLVLKYFIKKLFAAVGKPISINRIYNDLKSQGYKVTNNALYDYQVYCQSIFLTISIPRFDFSELKSAKSEKKTFAIDSGLLASIDFSFSDNLGKLFENVVLLEFLKQEKTIYYYKDKVECDFIVQDGNQFTPFQVAYELKGDSTRKRELKGVVAACKALNLQEGYVLTFEQKEDLEMDGVQIKILPYYEYFLGLK